MIIIENSILCALILSCSLATHFGSNGPRPLLEKVPHMHTNSVEAEIYCKMEIQTISGYQLHVDGWSEMSKKSHPEIIVKNASMTNLSLVGIGTDDSFWRNMHANGDTWDGNMLHEAFLKGYVYSIIDSHNKQNQASKHMSLEDWKKEIILKEPIIMIELAKVYMQLKIIVQKLKLKIDVPYTHYSFLETYMDVVDDILKFWINTKIYFWQNNEDTSAFLVFPPLKNMEPDLFYKNQQNIFQCFLSKGCEYVAYFGKTPANDIHI